MSRKKSHLNPASNTIQDAEKKEDSSGCLENLVEQLVVAEATEAVWGKFENILTTMEPSSLDIFEQYLDGLTVQQISEERQLSEKDVNNLITKLKRDIINHLRNECGLKQ